MDAMHTTTKIFLSLFVLMFIIGGLTLYPDTTSKDPILPHAEENEDATTTKSSPPPEETAPENEPAAQVPEKPIVKETPEPPLSAAKVSPPPSPPKQEPDTAVENTEEGLPFSTINLETREALVNIFCLTKSYSANITPISGSGTIIDKKGVILTNAHIAQYFLLEDYPTEGFVNCLIRTGSPARAMYKATLLYVSPSWISENATVLTTENPTGTGEHDFALLLIDEALQGPLPSEFPYIPPETGSDLVDKTDSILVGAYPAGLLGAKTIQQDLYASTAIVQPKEFYTFSLEAGTLDVISLGGSVVAQQGSSGGAVVNKYGKMIGLISTSSDGETTGDRDLRAITLEHIERSLLEHNNTTLEELLSGDLEQKARDFNETVAPGLLQILVNTFSNP